MHPCSREMQSLNSLLNSPPSQIPIPLQNHSQIQINHDTFHQSHNSHDDFLKQILSTLPSSSSWNNLDPTNSNPKPLWDSNSDETPLSDNVHFPNYDEHTNLASKFRNHQINDKAAALMLLRGADSGLLQMPLNPADFDSSQNDVVDASSVQALYNGFSGSLHGIAQNNTNHHFQGQGFGGSVSATNQAPASGTPGQPRQKIRARRGQATDPHSIAERVCL